MSTKTITVDFPDDILIALNESEKELKQRIRIILAIQLYKIQKLTIGKASQLAGLSRLAFETELSLNNISISDLSVNEVFGDMTKLR